MTVEGSHNRSGMWATRPRSTAIALLALLLMTLPAMACAAPAATSPLAVVPAATPTPEAPQPIVFPSDEAPHSNLSEWWYYTGHLRTDSGKEYGFELVVFQAVRYQSPVGYAAHFAITDLQRRSFTYEERSASSLQVQGNGRYQLTVGGWQMQGDGNGDAQLQAAGKQYSIDLKLHSVKPAMLHNGVGWISFGPVGDSYYYSRGRMEVTGSIDDDGVTEPVTGLAWMDHQWGDFIIVNGGGWDWYSLQLSDGTEVMATVLRDQPGNVAATYGSYSDESGKVTDLKAADVDAVATGSWTSPHTGAKYPSGWRVRLPNQGLDLTVEPAIPDQELDTRQTTGVAYWEGDVRVTGTRNGAPISGQGYVELTGYAR
jgi:predicted secreted hydrolase